MAARATILLTLAAILTGCGAAGGPGTSASISNLGQTRSTPATVAPAVVSQPASLSVPIGLAGIFSVEVAGDGTLTGQWYRNGVAVPGANSESYTTPAVSAGDSGALYTFTVSNSLGSATSQSATLTAAARAPQQNDLRFQQVDALSTVNGYTAFEQSAIPGRGGQVFSMYSGSPIWMESNDCGSIPSDSGITCDWQYATNYLPDGAGPIATVYFADYYSNFESDLSAGEFPSSQFGGGPILAGDNVITSLAVSTVNDLFAISYIQNTTGGFDLAQHTIAPAQMQAAAEQEGQASRVITAVAFSSGQIVYLSYGWTGDTATVFETQTAIATFATAPSVAASLAAQGYTLTAMGGDDADGLVLVGTRVKGDTLARPVLIAAGATRAATEAQIQQQGYAIVGAVETVAGDPTTLSVIAER